MNKVHVTSDRDSFTLSIDAGGGGGWGIGVRFITHDAALDVAGAICEAKRSEGDLRWEVVDDGEVAYGS